MGDGAEDPASAWPAVQTLPKSSSLFHHFTVASLWGGKWWPQEPGALAGREGPGLGWGSEVQVWSLFHPAQHLPPESAWRQFPVRWWPHTNLWRQPGCIAAQAVDTRPRSLDWGLRSPPAQGPAPTPGSPESQPLSFHEVVTKETTE